MHSLSRWIVWSWRDLRGHWPRVVVISLIIALGTGAYAGLSSNARWRLVSADHNYELLNMYDLRIRLASGSQVEEGSLIASVAGMDHPEWVTAAEERLVVPTQVDASRDGETILVRGVVVGVPVDPPGAPTVNAVHPGAGRALTTDDDGAPVGLIERNFALFYDLPDTGTIQLGGGTELDIVGHGITPEYFFVQPEGELFFSQANYAAVFTSLTTAQIVTGSEGLVSDMVVTLAEGVDPDAAADDLSASLAKALPTVGTSIMEKGDDPTYRLVYEDIENDQLFFNMLALIIFVGAVAAAFNLTSRLVEQQRREIGIAMALGVPRWRISVRPMLVGVQIAVLGVVFGLGAGWLITVAMRGLLESLLPFAEWLTPFQAGVFATAAFIGFLVPLAATAIPVWRAVRVLPVDAIRTGHLASRGGGLAPLIQRVPLPGDTFSKMPFRNLVRAPRRAALTIVGIAAALSALVMILGAIDSFIDTIDRGAEVETSGNVDRVLVALDTVHPVDGTVVASVTGVEGAAAAEPALLTGGALVAPDTEFDVSLRFVDFDGDIFLPEASKGRLPVTGEILLSAKAAKDLGVDVGESVIVRHPQRQGPLAFTLVETPYVVSGFHDHPFRINTYLPKDAASDMGLAGLANIVDITPEPGVAVGDLQRALFTSASVVSVQRADSQATIIRDFLDVFIEVFQLFLVVVLMLAVLIAFNAAGISVEERKRENATLFAYGVPRWKAVRISVVESLMIGAIATVFGLLGGLGLLWWFLNVLARQSMPEIGFDTVLSPGSVLVTVVIGVLAVGLAPLLTAPRRLRRMDVPSTLRVME
ncbi:MAG: FtsX-like permease family protein [Acidimicrobiia bacterium]